VTDSELLAQALARVAPLSDERAAAVMGVSEGSVRRWREVLQSGERLQLRAPQRLVVERFLAGGNTESVDYWRGRMAAHRDTLRAIVQTMDAQLAGQGASAPVAPAPMSGGVGDGADAGALLGTHTSRRRRSKEA
jgi:hypothetical protein